MKEAKEFFERNKKTIKRAGIGAAVGATSALLLYYSFKIGVAYGTGWMYGFVKGVLEKNNYQEAFKVIDEAAKALSK